jgi:tetratricopeptide (TPR) repeat protein
MAQLTIQQEFDLALQHHQAGRVREAEQLYRRVLAQQPEHIDAMHNLGVLAHQTGRNDVAVELIRRAIALRPDFAEAHSNLGSVLTDMGQPDGAIAACRQAIALRGNYAEAHSNLGNALRDKGQLDEAIAAYRQAIALKGEFAEAHNKLGGALREKGEVEEAIAAYRQAIALNRNFPEAHSNLGNALREKGQLEDAVVAIRQAIALRPDFAEGHSNLAVALIDVGQLEEAIAACRRAIELKSDFAPTHWNYALLLLMMGEFEEGWKEFEWRLRVPQMRLARDFPQPRWTGQEARGKTILLFAEGGFGDALHFIRYAPLVAERGATVLLECQAELVPLLNRVRGISAVFARGECLPAFDWQTPLPSLPLAFGTTMKTIPADVPYLSAPPDRIEQWAKRLAGDSSLKVGLAWAGSAEHDARSCPLAALAPLAAIPDVTFYGLQKGPQANQTVPAGMRLIQMGDELHDFADTAGLVSNLDLVISVDTSVVHLAGGMGRPVWTLLSERTELRWLRDRTDSPWYPTMRLFRQSARGDWDSVITRVAEALSLAKE